ncbi:hypothetical protein WJX72_005685 [[Myrmecia] bisecta]|uniref:Large ribosomal subunit protein bL9c n=1 Tax=[Myrmecia] bisecta TaxID=41462 RepID=A0AAW1NZZ9_9CHLO
MAAAQIMQFEGLRSTGVRQCVTSGLTSGRTVSAAPRSGFSVVCQKKVKKTQQVVLTQSVVGLGGKGTLTKVPNGYFRNFLQPQQMAVLATEGVLANIQREIDAKDRVKREEKAKAQAMATALQTIGKFTIRKKTGEKDQIFGSVTAQDIIDAIAQQTGRTLDKREVTLPDIKTTGTFDASIRLHPEVAGNFKVVVQREKNAN